MTEGPSAAADSSAPRVHVIGEALIDIIISASGTVTEHVGGSPANVAIGLARLGHPTELTTWIGQDPRGRRIAALMRAEGVHLAPESTSAAQTSTAQANLDATGAAQYTFDLCWAPPVLIGNTPPRHVHTGSIAATITPGADHVLDAIRAVRPTATVSYDPNVRPSLMGSPDAVRQRVETLVGLADVVKASDEDLAWLYPGVPVAEVLSNWASLGPAICALTQGADAVVVAVAKEQRRCPTRPTAVADTVGAGDSFMAGLISGLLDLDLLGGADARRRLADTRIDEVSSAVNRALACAAITVSRAGADPPVRAEL
jgi:fructokinase